MANIKNILTTKAAGKILGIRHDSVSKAIKRGRLKATKFGASWMIALEDVKKYQKKYSKSKNK